MVPLYPPNTSATQHKHLKHNTNIWRNHTVRYGRPLTSDNLLGTSVVHLNLLSVWREHSVKHIWLPLKERTHTVKLKLPSCHSSTVSRWRTVVPAHLSCKGLQNKQKNQETYGETTGWNGSCCNNPALRLFVSMLSSTYHTRPCRATVCVSLVCDTILQIRVSAAVGPLLTLGHALSAHRQTAPSAPLNVNIQTNSPAASEVTAHERFQSQSDNVLHRW